MQLRKAKQIAYVLTLLILITFLSSCSIFPKKEPDPIVLKTQPVTKPQLIVPSTTPLNLNQVTWYVVTADNIDDVMKELDNNNKDLVLFGLTDDGYTALSENTADIMQLLQQQQLIIAAYQEYYESVNKKIDEVNKTIKEDTEALTDDSTAN